ncbi:hypothetical protein [Pseudomonas subflava]|uniref:hypothetical protein n=1 Tax=Pseudomonas subflava TaxID=2952933 RepID=UPI002079E882|nr:hypothetical protein [Pseudomonas subflava]
MHPVVRAAVVLLISLSAGICQAELLGIPGSPWRVESHCGKNVCEVSLTDGATSEQVLQFPSPPSHASHESGIFLLTFGCGTACSATYAYKLGGFLGGPFPLVEVADNEREVLMSLGDRSVRFYRMFEANDKPLYEITPEFGGYSLLESIADTGIEDHVFRVTYQGKADLEMLEYEAPPLP